jgi:arylsulfatase A-like enzyme
MARRFFILAALALAVLAGAPLQTNRPKLVLGIVVDQFRYDYLTRFRSDYSGGLDRLLRRGAVFTNARFEHYPTVTAVGHAVFMTGATPSLSGIIGNDWYDREAGKKVTSVSDDNARLLGAEGAGASPRRLLASTLGDEMKMARPGKPRVIGVSIKDRGAILPAGRMADGAYWFDGKAGVFVSSSFYFEELPGWVSEFNARRPADKYAKIVWTPLLPNADFPAFSKTMPDAPGAKLYAALEASPYGNELVEALAERAIEAERLGQRGETDLLTVSFSANDYVGHDAGPHAPEVRDMAIRVDRLIGRLLDFADSKVGPGNTLVVLAGDHGVPPLPELMQKWRMPAGRLSAKAILDEAERALKEKFGDGGWIVGSTGPAPYFNRDLIRAKNLSEAEVERVAAEAVSRLPHIFRVYTRHQLLNGEGIRDRITRNVVNGFYPSRASDLVVLEEAYWIQAAKGTTHGAVFGYDSHVPVIFMGSGVRQGSYHRNVTPNDIAPTLATMLGVETPSGSVGRVLDEMLGQ